MPKLSDRAAELSPSPTLAISAKAKELKAAGKPVIALSAGEPDFATAPHIVKAAQAAAADPAAHKYSAASGQPALREAIAARASAMSGIEYTAAQALVTNGGKHALYSMFQTLFGPGDEVLIPAPYWVSYPAMVRLAGATPVIVKTTADNNWMPTAEQLKAATTPGTRGFIHTSPSNPTGAVATEAQTATIAAWARDTDAWIITDEIYSQLVYSPADFVSLGQAAPDLADRLIVADGVAKAWAMTGWRVGWAVGPQNVLKAAGALQSQLCSNVNNVAQAAALAALTGPQDAVSEMREAFDRRRKLTVEGLDSIDGIVAGDPQGAFYVFANISEAMRTLNTADDVAFATRLLEEANVAVVPGSAFGAPEHMRVSFATSDDNLVEAIDRIGHLLA